MTAQNAEPGDRTNRVFVYGTLKRGLSNHRFLKDSVFVGDARTVDRYALYVDLFPGVYPKEAVSVIQGEVYEVDAAALSRLDFLEDHPRLYRREIIRVQVDGGEETDAWIYFSPGKAGRLLIDGEFNPRKELGLS